MCFSSKDTSDNNTPEKDISEKELNNIETILSCAGLLHDLGNPPFGHVGESIIGEWFEKNLKVYFEEVFETTNSKDQSVRDMSDALVIISQKKELKKEISELEKKITKLSKESSKDNSDSTQKKELYNAENAYAKIQMCMDLCKFEGNAQALRILSKADYGSEFDMPFSVISALIKYPTKSTLSDKNSEELIRHKPGFFYAEQESFVKIAGTVGTNIYDTESFTNTSETTVRHPLAYLVEAADDIAYMTADLEDAVCSGLVSTDQLLAFFDFKISGKDFDNRYSKRQQDTAKENVDVLRELNKNETDKNKVIAIWGNYLRPYFMNAASYSFKHNKDKILNGTFKKELLSDTFNDPIANLLKSAMKEFVYDSPTIVKAEMSGQKILSFLLDNFVPAVIHLVDDGDKLVYGENMTEQDKLAFKLIPHNYVDDYIKYKKQKEKKNKEDKIDPPELDEVELFYRKILIATDFISGMTDGYARSLYRKMMGIE
ncbi:MAG: dNTP triphosphohydrolase [Clostridiales bacterium]|nr:dNTP triphosphohydrolase [Clostridiales bacterium]